MILIFELFCVATIGYCIGRYLSSYSIWRSKKNSTIFHVLYSMEHRRYELCRGRRAIALFLPDSGYDRHSLNRLLNGYYKEKRDKIKPSK